MCEHMMCGRQSADFCHGEAAPGKRREDFFHSQMTRKMRKLIKSGEQPFTAALPQRDLVASAEE